MTDAWSAAELALLYAAGELRIAARRSDGSLRRPVPIRVVCADGQAYVRTWYRRDTGRFGDALRSHRARVHVQGQDVDVTVEHVGTASPQVTVEHVGTASPQVTVEHVGTASPQVTVDVDAAYRTKYGHGGADSMLTPEAAATTLRLTANRIGD